MCVCACILRKLWIHGCCKHFQTTDTHESILLFIPAWQSMAKVSNNLGETRIFICCMDGKFVYSCSRSYIIGMIPYD